MTPELSLRIEQALDAAAQSRIGGVAALPGNPLEVETRTWDGLNATVVRRPILYYGYYNAIRGVHEAEPGAPAEALAWCRREGASPRLTTSPVLADESTLAALSEQGMRVIGFMSLLYGPPSPTAPASSIEVYEVSPGSRGAFEELWLGDAALEVRPNLRTLCAGEFASWRVYAAFDRGALPEGNGIPAAGAGVPAAYGCLYVSGGVGVLASGFTRPSSRGRGLQSALIARRTADAASAGCDIVVSTAVPGSQSERNLRRAGLSLGYTQSIWGPQ